MTTRLKTKQQKVALLLDGTIGHIGIGLQGSQKFNLNAGKEGEEQHIGLIWLVQEMEANILIYNCITLVVSSLT